MDRQEITGQLESLLAGYIKEQGFTLVDLSCRYEGQGLVLRVLADRPRGGITIDECSCLNQEIIRLLDEQGILSEGYVLEVSSPGLDRPLSGKNDYLRCVSREVRFFLSEPINDKVEYAGTIIDADEDNVYIDNRGENLTLPLVKVRKAKQLIK